MDKEEQEAKVTAKSPSTEASEEVIVVPTRRHGMDIVSKWYPPPGEVWSKLPSEPE